MYKLDSFAYGIKTPVSKVLDFHFLLLKWNKESCDSPFAPTNGLVDSGSSEPENRFNRIQSETPLKSVWIHLRQLESVTLAKKSILKRSKADGIDIEEEVAISKGNGLAFALRNASDYFRSAKGRNANQRILSLYYGTLAFAFAEMLYSPIGPKTLVEIEEGTKQGHGLFTLDGKAIALKT